MIPKCLAELIGTFVLVFAGTGAIIASQPSSGSAQLVGIALTFGLAVMTMIYSIGDVSGAHLNPAVTFGFYLAGRFPAINVIPYMASQVAGALLASVAASAIFGYHANLGATLPSGSPWQSFDLEVVVTGILVFVILSVSTGPKEVGTLAGIAVGGAIMLDIFLAGPISGASMNPARSLGPAVISGNYSNLWIYLTAPFLGAAVAVPSWWIIRAGRGINPALVRAK